MSPLEWVAVAVFVGYMAKLCRAIGDVEASELDDEGES